MRRTLFDETHELFRESFRSFVEKEIVPHHAAWEAAGITDRALFFRAAEAGFLGISAPPEHGGGGTPDFRFSVVICEELCRAGVFNSGVNFTTHNDVCFPYFLSATTPEQKARWIPGMCSGELMTAVAMTEPGTGSDLASIRTTAAYVMATTT